MTEFNVILTGLFIALLTVVIWLRFNLRILFRRSLARQSQKMFAGCEVARRMLDSANLGQAVIQRDAVFLEYYDTSSDVLHLTPQNYWNCAVISYACIAHAIGQAIRHQESGFLATLTHRTHQLSRIAAFCCIPLILLGMAVGKAYFVNFGMLFFVAAFCMRIIFIPLQLSVNRHGIRLLDSIGVVSPTELPKITGLMKKISLAHTAALLGDLLQPFELLFIRHRED